MRIVDNGWRMPFFGKLEKHVGFRIRSKGTLCGKSVYQAKKFGDVDPKIATSQKAQKELIALSAITCPAKLCETCQKNFPPFFDVKIEEIML